MFLVTTVTEILSQGKVERT